MESMQEIVAWHDDRALMDYVTCGTGSYFDFYKLMPTSLYPARLGEPFAAALKEVRHTRSSRRRATSARRPRPRPCSPPATPTWCRSCAARSPTRTSCARPARAAPSEVRPCISCNQLCWGRRSRDYWISCLVNPSAGREHIWGGDRFVPAEQPKTVLVVGGGPAGLEAARVCAERGHEVIVVEAGPQIGGQWRLAGAAADAVSRCSTTSPGTHASSLGSASTCGSNTLVDGAWIAAAGADDRRRRDRCAARPGRLPTGGADERSPPGYRRAQRRRDRGRARRRGRRPSGRVLLLDDVGDWRGIGTAMFLQERGCDVCIATSAPAVAAGLFHSAADVPARRRFAGAGGDMRPHTVVDAWRGDAATLRSTLTGEVTSEPFDWLVIAETPRSNDELGLALDRAGVAFHQIGDCVAPRRASLAFYEGRSLAMRL